MHSPFASPSRPAFTLIELLVVVSLIVLLVAMLLPALSRARDSAHNVHCASNLKQIGDGVGGYVVDHQGWLPTHFGGGGNPFVTYWMNETPPSMSGVLKRVNLGLLLDRMPSPEIYYCASIAGDPRSALSLNGPDNPWNDSEGDSINRLRSSYPARSRQAEPGVVLNGRKSHWRIKRYAGKVLYSDFVGVDHWNGGGIINGLILAPHRGEGVNLLFDDMSVRWSPTNDVNDFRPVGPTTPNAVEQLTYYEILDETN